MRPLNATDRPYIANYRLLRRLAPGGMGEVFLGQAEGGSILVVKVVAREGVNGQAERFTSEMEATSRVRGRYVAHIRGMDPHGSPPWLATDYYPGPSLLHAVSGAGALPPAAVLALAAGLCHALVAIHRAGVVHGDLTPGNVLLLADGPRVIDFGICGVAEGSRPLDGPRYGTTGFVPPEYYGAPAGPPTPAGDVYALGAVLCFALSGATPGAPIDAAALAHVPEPLRGIVLACTGPDPERRPTPAGLLEVLLPHGLPIESMFGPAWLPADLMAGIAYGEAELARLAADPTPHVMLPAPPAPPPPPAPWRRAPALSPTVRAAVVVSVIAAVVAAGAVAALGDTLVSRTRASATATAGPPGADSTATQRPGQQQQALGPTPLTRRTTTAPVDDGMIEDSSDHTPCVWTERSEKKRALPFRCPLLWDGERTSDAMTRIPVYATFTSQGLGPDAAVNQLYRSAGAQYFKCHVRGAGYDFAPQHGWGRAHHVWWALTQGDEHPGRWGFVPEVYFLGGADDVPDPGLAVCSDADLTLAV
jgi:serine/threonine protein kinase